MNIKARNALKEYREKVKSGEIVPGARKKRPSMVKAIKAKCKDCMADYQDGRLDCEIPSCSLYHWMSYRDKSSNLLVV